MLVTLDRGQPNGGFALLAIAKDTRTIGMELNGGVGYRFGQLRLTVQALNLTNTQAIQQMAQRTGEDILRVNGDGTAVSLVTTGAAAGTTTTSRYTTGLGIMPRTIQAGVSWDF